MQSSDKPTVAVIGLGMWGEKLVRVATASGIRTYGFDLSTNRSGTVASMYPGLIIADSYEDILRAPDIHAVVIATSPSTHFRLASEALRLGKDVLIEKPMTQDVRQAGTLARLAKKLGRILMVDHTYLYSPALHAANASVRQGSIGRVTRIESVRLGSRGLADSTVLWDLAPHDVAIAHFLLGADPVSVRTLAVQFSGTVTPDDATIELNFPGSVRYVAHLSWNNPVKERMLTLIGTTGALALRWDGGKELLTRYDGHREFPIATPAKEPLAEMLTAFVKRVRRNGHDDALPPDRPYANVRVVSALHRSWISHGKTIPV